MASSRRNFIGGLFASVVGMPLIGCDYSDPSPILEVPNAGLSINRNPIIEVVSSYPNPHVIRVKRKGIHNIQKGMDVWAIPVFDENKNAVALHLIGEFPDMVYSVCCDSLSSQLDSMRNRLYPKDFVVTYLCDRNRTLDSDDKRIVYMIGGRDQSSGPLDMLPYD